MSVNIKPLQMLTTLPFTVQVNNRQNINGNNNYMVFFYLDVLAVEISPVINLTYYITEDFKKIFQKLQIVITQIIQQLYSLVMVRSLLILIN
ncbi:unnamed protein product [Paramecium octaurelia]|uniref:Uncharacterized protein n=1 Tax=Paramecium octaurelia TaxID=43137 RepID=A0A8S1YG10_PAROT|nr:unnamed protein product [Paramecium octaurelia]